MHNNKVCLYMVLDPVQCKKLFLEKETDRQRQRERQRLGVLALFSPSVRGSLVWKTLETPEFHKTRLPVIYFVWPTNKCKCCSANKPNKWWSSAHFVPKHQCPWQTNLTNSGPQCLRWLTHFYSFGKLCWFYLQAEHTSLRSVKKQNASSLLKRHSLFMNKY